MNIHTARKLMPIITIGLTIVGAVVYIRLSCENSAISQCGNVTQLIAQNQRPQSAFIQFLNLWSVG